MTLTQRLFDAYALTVHIIAQEGRESRVMVTDSLQTLEVALRAFELMLLREIGFLPSLKSQTANLADLQAETAYVLIPRRRFTGCSC